MYVCPIFSPAHGHLLAAHAQFLAFADSASVSVGAGSSLWSVDLDYFGYVPEADFMVALCLVFFFFRNLLTNYLNTFGLDITLGVRIFVLVS